MMSDAYFMHMTPLVDLVCLPGGSRKVVESVSLLSLCLYDHGPSLAHSVEPSPIFFFVPPCYVPTRSWPKQIAFCQEARA